MKGLLTSMISIYSKIMHLQIKSIKINNSEHYICHKFINSMTNHQIVHLKHTNQILAKKENNNSAKLKYINKKMINLASIKISKNFSQISLKLLEKHLLFIKTQSN